MKKNSSTILLVFVFMIGLSLLLYPSLSNYWNSFHQTRAIASYQKEVADIDGEKYDEILQNAVEYNKKVSVNGNQWILSAEQKKDYESQLNIDGNGIMGYVEIPSIRCTLPIYHGTDDSVLQIAVGHIEGSTLPVGGKNTHCVISGHRGLPSAKIFTRLDELKEGDIFMMRILDEVLTYEVDAVNIVEPDDVSKIQIEQGKDLCTLVTCTPYGVNSHRLLVRGHRIENIDDVSARIVADAIQVDPVIVAPIVATPILLVLLIILLVKYRKR